MSESLPFFSVVVPTYRRAETLATCLNALAGQVYPRSRFEVVVVEDGGGVPLQPLLGGFKDRLNLTLISQPHAGPGKARNTGAEHARGELLAFTDDDCAPDTHWLACMAARFAATPGHLVGGHTANALHHNRCSAASQLLVQYLYEYYNADPARPSFFASNNMALPRDAFLDVGGFDAALTRAAGEDRELCDRWRHLGRGLTYAPEAVVYHYHDLTAWQFCCQHFRYGRAAFYFRQKRVQRGSGHIAIEPLSFYANLLRYPFAQEGRPGAAVLSALLLLSQVANAAGFGWERAMARPQSRSGSR